MQTNNFRRIKTITTGIVTITILGFLFWEHMNGGVKSHHFLQQKDMPSISNWWGGLLLPILSWFLLSRVEKRLEMHSSQIQQTNKSISKVLWLALTGLIFGILISVSFMNGFKLFLDYVLYILIALSFVIPLYYSEFILGFILGMSFTFGAILPTLFILVIAAIGLLTYKFIRPLILKIVTKIGNN